MRERGKLKSEYDKLTNDYWDNMEKKDGPVFAIVGGKFKTVAEGFAKIGDHYYASQAWMFYGICFGEDSQGDAADLYKAYEGASKAVAARAPRGSILCARSAAARTTLPPRASTDRKLVLARPAR